MILLNIFNLVGLLTFCQMALAIEPTGLDVSIRYDGSFGYHLTLQNNNDYFICISRDSTNTYDKLLALQDEHGKDLIPLTFRDIGSNNTQLGFDFSDSYFILRPNEGRQFFLDLTNFSIHEGKYKYSLKASVFKCKDVVDESRVKKNRDVRPILIEQEGTIEFGKQFIKLNNEIREQNKDQLPPV